jgi:hypothetical protein
MPASVRPSFRAMALAVLRSMPGMPKMTPQGEQETSSMPMGPLQPMMCQCPSSLGRVGAIAVLVFGALVTGSAAAALIALTLFLLRRSHPA